MTRYLTVDPESPSPEALSEAGQVLRDGGIVAFPTETVYGLAAAAPDAAAVARLREIKDRPDEPFTYLVPNVAVVEALVGSIPPRAQALANRYWPGPLTLILPTGEAEGEAGESLGTRVPASAVALGLLTAAESLLVAPSANPRAKPPATTADEVREYFDGEIDLVLDGGPVTLKESSTIVQFTSDGYSVLREGIITTEMVHQLVSGKTLLFVCTGNTCRSPMAAELFRKHLAEKIGKGVEELPELGFRIESAGIFATWGSRASEGAKNAMKERGCDLDTHISQPLTRELLGEADRVFALTQSHLDNLVGLEPGVRPRAQLLAERSIPDPIGGPDQVYRECADVIEDAVKEIVADF
ncbi:MAG: L-threonylcarbamoyladenylate synthase [Planctomycetota bacterium]